MKSKVINSILMDDLKEAELLIAKKPERFEIISSLLKKVKNKPFPLNTLKARAPKNVGIFTSYICELRCEMCSFGFGNRTFLFDDYKYFLPEQFDKLSFWINSASNITFVGAGETLNSPYVYDFLKKTGEKHSQIFTNGIPLTGENICSLINAKLNSLVLSFDGKLSVGHGKGSEKYIKWFWKKVELIQQIKKNSNSLFPTVKLTVVVANENIDDLNNVIGTALDHDINHIMLNFMAPINEKMFRKSIFANYDESKKRINSILSMWNKKGALVTVTPDIKKMRDSLKVCPTVDNWLHFHGRSKTICVCCGGPIKMPLFFSDIPLIKHWNSFPFRYFRYLHFCTNRDELPHICKNCGSVNPKETAKICVSFYNHSNDKKEASADPLTFYKAASKVKQNNLNSRAEKLFLEVLKLKPDPELKGKVYFHLGEMQLGRKNFKEALHFMKLAVQHCFNHRMAFVYLYLLLMLIGEKKIKKRRERFKMVSAN